MDRFILRVLSLGLTLFWLGPVCEASSLGMTVHVVPQSSDGGKTVRAHFTVIAPNPCPALTGLCADGEDCVTYPTSSPMTGTKPNPGWCVRQWQKNVPSNYNAKVNLGSNVEFYVSLKAGPIIRANTGRLNHPPFVALPPPLRALVNCPHHFHLSIKDLDGDRVQCRFARADQGECLDCAQHSFIELNEETCMLTFTGKASVGQYSIYLMAEDIIPVPKMRQVTQMNPLSAVPVHLSLTVEKASLGCSDEPVAAGRTPKEDTTLFVLPYDQADLTVQFISEQESVSEVAVVGPPELYRSQLRSLGPVAVMSMAWVRGENKLTHLLPICFVVNTQSLQSEPRCIWLFQREKRSLPDGTELKCDNTQMSLLLPVATLKNINLNELMLNSPTCPVTYNDTHVKALIPLNGCGTKIVHSGSEMIYTNTLQSVRPYTVIDRLPSLILPLACRIPGVQATGPQYKVYMPSEKETFGDVRFWLDFYIPGEGPLSKFTRNAKTHRLLTLSERVRRDVDSISFASSTSTNSSTTTNSEKTNASRTDKLDLYVRSNCSVDRAELIVSKCTESKTEDFNVSVPILVNGCSASQGSIEVIETPGNTKVYRLDLGNLGSLGTQGTTMYMKCTVNLCIAMMPSQKCPDLCSRSRLGKSLLIDSVFTKSYTVKSGPVDLAAIIAAPTKAAPTKAAPTTTVPGASTAAPTATAATTAAPAAATAAPTTAHAPEKASAMAMGLMLVSICIFLQNIVLC